MRVTDSITVVTNLTYQSKPTNGGSAITPQTDTVEVGPVFDVVPNVMADGYTINLAITTSVTEFLGYDNPLITDALKSTGQLPSIHPRFSVRSLSTTLNLWDGQTAVLAGLHNQNITRDKVPVLGDVPLMGRLFRSAHTNETDTIVLVTATIVDPAGNRVHADDELPFAPKDIPVQPQPQTK